LAKPFVPTQVNTWAFPADCPDPSAASPMDLRFLNEAVAGANGPLRASADGNDLVLADGRRFVAWMVHMPHGLNYELTRDAWSLDDYRKSARFLARYGVNLGIIGTANPAAGSADPLAANPVVLEALHRSVAAAKEVGIYTQLRIAWFHDIKGKQLSVAGHEDKDMQCLVFFHPRVQEAWKAWARGLLTPVNPYTGVALKDEPSLFSVEIVNEDSLLFYVTDGIQGKARAELERQFGAWCIRKYGSIDKAIAAWNGFGDKADSAAEGRLGIVVMWMLTRDGRGRVDEQRVRDQLEFLTETMASWNRQARRYILDEIGARHVLVAGSNFIPADRVTMDDALRLIGWADMDLIENNIYFDAGGKSRIAGWRADAGGFVGLRSAVLDPLGLPTNKRQVEGKPFFCTEILWPRPHPYEVEGPLLVAAYQTLNGIDGLAWAGPRDVTWEGREAAYFTFFREDGQMAMKPFACAGPATMGQFPAAAAIARLGLVKPGPTVVRETRTSDQIIARESPAIAEEFAYDPTQFGRGQAQDTAIAGGVPKEAYLVGRAAVSLGNEPAPPQIADISPYIKDGVVTPGTGELVMDVPRRLFTIDAPAAQCAVGFLRDAGKIELSQATIQSDAPHGTVAIVALDALPLSESRRILVQVGTRSVPTGWRESAATWEEAGQRHEGLRIDATGDLPWRVQKAKVTIELKAAVADKATAMDGNGLPIRKLDIVRDGNGVRLDVPENVMYVILQ
jgi:hypothetical protein